MDFYFIIIFLQIITCENLNTLHIEIINGYVLVDLM